MPNCTNCNKSPIFIKKRSLCRSCYNKLRYRGRTCVTGASPRHASEIEFVKRFFTHKNWFYQPVIFRLSKNNYEPDFYDGERNVYIEVVGTRQAFDANKEKYREFIATFPKVGFEIRRVDGSLIDLDAKRQSWES